MRLSTTFVLAIAAAAAAGGLWWTLRTPPPAPPPAGEPLFRVSAGELARIELRRGKSFVRLEPVNSVWNIKQPIQDRLDNRAAIALFLGLNGLELYRVIGPVKNPSSYGLGPLGARVGLYDRDGGILQDLVLGHVTPWISGEDPTMYAQWLNGPTPEDVLVVGGNLRILLDQSVDALRSRQALHLPRPPLRIEIRRGLEVIEIARDSETSPWRIERPIEERADQAAVNRLLADLSQTETTELVPWTPVSHRLADAPRLRILTTPGPSTQTTAQPEEEPRENAGAIPEETDNLPSATQDAELQTPPAISAAPSGFPPLSSSLAFRIGPPLVEAAFFPHPDDPARTLARFSDRRYDLTLDAPPESWLPLDVDHFRARTLANFRPDDIESIALRDAAGNRRVIVRDADRWMVSTASDMLRADRMTVRDTILAINITPILDFPDDAPGNLSLYGLDFPVLEASLLLRGGLRHRLTFGEDPDGNIFARFDDRPSVYRVPRSTPGLLPISPAPWRARSLSDFTAIDLRQIRIAEKDQPEIVLRYNPMENLWIALVDGEIRTRDLDPVAAASLAVSLEILTAHRWLPETNAAALAALNHPDFDLLLTVISPDDLGEDMAPIRTRLRLARAAPNSPFFVGRINDEPDLFLIRDNKLDALRLELFHEE